MQLAAGGLPNEEEKEVQKARKETAEQKEEYEADDYTLSELLNI